MVQKLKPVDGGGIDDFFILEFRNDKLIFSFQPYKPDGVLFYEYQFIDGYRFGYCKGR